MTIIKIDNFGGELPSVSPRALPATAGQVNKNLYARTTEFRPLGSDTAEATLTVTNPTTIFRYRNSWLASTAAISFVRGQVNGDARDSLYYSFNDGTTPPRVLDSSVSLPPASLATAGRQLGVPAPTHAPGAEVQVQDELSVDELPEMRAAALVNIRAAFDASFTVSYQGNAIAPAEPSSSQIGWVAHGAAGMPSVAAHQWNLLVPMNGSVPAAGFEFIQHQRFGGRQVTYSGVSYWAVPMELFAPVKQIYEPALRDALEAVKDPYDDTKFVFDPDRSGGTPEIDSIVASSDAYWSADQQPYLALLNDALSRTSVIKATLDNTVDGIPAAFYRSTTFESALASLVGTGNTGDGIVRTAFQAQKFAEENPLTGDMSFAYTLDHRYYSWQGGSEGQRPSNVRADTLACITTDSLGRKTFNADKFRNTFLAGFEGIIALRPAEVRSILRARLTEVVEYCIEPWLSFFSPGNLVELSRQAEVDRGAALYDAMQAAKVALNRLRDLSTDRSAQTAAAAENAFNLGPALRLVQAAVARIVETRFYLCTYVNDRGEESSPSPVSIEATLDQNDSVLVTCPKPTAGRNITAVRIYRSNAGSGSAAFQYLTELNNGAALYFSAYPDVATAYAADNQGLTQAEYAEVHYRKHGYIEKRQSPDALAKATPVTDTYWNTAANLQYTDRKLAADLQEVIPSTTWMEPPANLRGLIGMPNGIMAGFFDSTVCFCEPYTPYAWPVEYQIATEDRVVAMAVFGQTLVVGTTGFPYFISGADSASMSAQKLDSRQACVSARSMIAVDGGVVFASPDGLCLASGSGIRVLTEQIFTRDEWQKRSPSTMSCAYHDGVAYLQCTEAGAPACYALDPVAGKLGRVDVTATAFYSDLSTDTLYAANGAAVAGLFRGTARTGYWKSKRVVMPQHTGFAWLAVESDFESPVTVKWTGWVQPSNEATKETDTVEVTSRQPVRLPARRFLEHEIEVQSAARINAVTLASSGDELRGV